MKKKTTLLKRITLLFALLMFSVVPASASFDENSDVAQTNPNITVLYEDENTLELMIPGYLVSQNPDQFPDLYNELMGPGTRSVVLTFLGKVAVEVAAGVIVACIVLEWNSGNPCARVYDWATKPSIPAPKYTGTIKYNTYAKFTPGKIPGCEPMYSGPCNTGYWTVRYDKVS